MAKEAATFESVKILPTSDLSDSQIRGFENSAKPWAPGEYVCLPMTHFTVESVYNGQKFNSNRIVLFKLGANDTVEYVRSWKIRDFNASCLSPEVAAYAVEVEERDGHKRIVRGQDILTGKMIRATSSLVPHRIEGKKFMITSPFIMHIYSRIAGVNAEYEGNQTDGYDVVTKEDGTVKFQGVTITPFETVDRPVSDNLVKACKEALKKDSSLNTVKLD